MEQMFDTTEMVEILLNNQIQDVLRKENYTGKFTINKVKGKKVKIKRIIEEQDIITLEVVQELVYSLIEKGKLKPRKSDIVLDILVDNEFINFVEVNFKLNLKRNTTIETTQDILNKVPNSKLAQAFSFDIDKDTASENVEEDITNNLTYVSGKEMIKVMLKESLVEKNRMNLINCRSMTYEEIDIAYKITNKTFENYRKQFLEKRFSEEESFKKALNHIGKAYFVKLYVNNSKESKMALSPFQPIEIQKRRPELTTIELCMFTNFFIKYKTKQIKTKKELIDTVYAINNPDKK